MKKIRLGKGLRPYISLVIAGMLMLSACGVTADVPVDDEDEPVVQYSEEEIRDRIKDIGRDYDGLEDSDDHIFNLFGSNNSLNSYNGGMVMYEAAADVEASVSSVGITPSITIDMDQPWNTEGYNHIDESGFISTGSNRFSTFGADVDTATYSNFRRTVYEQYELNEEVYPYGGLDPSAVRIEEMINYFEYSYPEAANGEKFSVSQTIVP